METLSVFEYSQSLSRSGAAILTPNSVASLAASILIPAPVTSMLVPSALISALVHAAFVSAFISALVSAPFIPAHSVFASTVARLVFGRFHKVNLAVAGVVFAAMTRPILGMSGWHVQVHRSAFIVFMVRPWRNNHWLRIDNRWRRRIADLHFTVDTRGDFSADSDADRGGSRIGRHTAEQE
jgi:hypothetical protein